MASHTIVGSSIRTSPIRLKKMHRQSSLFCFCSFCRANGFMVSNTLTSVNMKRLTWKMGFLWCIRICMNNKPLAINCFNTGIYHFTTLSRLSQVPDKQRVKLSAENFSESSWRNITTDYKEVMPSVCPFNTLPNLAFFVRFTDLKKEASERFNTDQWLG